MSIESPMASTAPTPSPAMGGSKKIKHRKDKASSPKKKRKREEREPKEETRKTKSKTTKHKSSHAEEKHKSKIKKSKSDSRAKHQQSSPFHVQSSSLYLPLAPVSQKFPLEGLCAEHLSPLLLSYYPPLGGILLSYDNVRFSPHEFGDDDSNDVALETFDEYAVCWAWVTAEFLLFKPHTGVWLEGYVNLQNEGHLGIVCWNMFNASIERSRLPRDWEWVGVEDMENEEEADEPDGMYSSEGVGYYVDGSGAKIEGIVKFRVKDVEINHDRDRGFLGIEGTMLDEDAENILVATEKEGLQSGTGLDPAARRFRGPKALGATVLGVEVPKEPKDKDGKGQRHRD